MCLSIFSFISHCSSTRRKTNDKKFDLGFHDFYLMLENTRPEALGSQRICTFYILQGDFIHSSLGGDTYNHPVFKHEAVRAQNF